MSACKTGINLLSWICVLISSGSVDAAAIFQSKASDSPAVGQEFHNITLSWTYSLGGTFISGSFAFVNVTSGSNVGIAQKVGAGSTDVSQGFKERFLASIADSEAHLTILSLQRSDQGRYEFQASATNFGSLSDEVDVEVQFEPENVQLSTNITVNKTCPGSYCNFTCLVGAANPEVTSYQLLENDIAVDTDSSGMWIRTLSNSGEFIYKCLANNTVGSTISANEKNITVTVSASVVRIVRSSDTVIEGNYFNVTCKASGDPKLIVYWIKEDTNQRINGSVLNFTNINRNDNGTYRCKAENDCGSDSRVEIINVFFKPENVQLITNITANNTCPGGYWNFTCSVGAANPQVTSYQLLENDIAVDTDSSGMWIRTLSNSGEFIYKCLANNTVGSTISANEKKITVAKRVSVVRIVNSSDTVIEGNSFNVVCNASDELIVFWIKEDTGQRINGSVLNFTSINRNDSGTYRCEAENDCGSDSRVEIISVSYPSNITFISSNVTVNQNESVNLTCRADGNPKPAITWSKDRNIINSSFTVRGKSDEGLYVCNASNGIGNASIKSVFITVEFTTATEESNITLTNSKHKGGPPWPIIGGAIGAVVLVIIVIVVAWWVHRKRKCRKDTKIHNSESQVLHGENDIEDGVHAKVNGGYADAGPQSANGTNGFVQPPPEQQQQQQAAAAPPAYAVVDKSKKKNKDKKNGNENIPDYAVVDKSKKKKKKAEVEDPYAEVEDPRQNKKTADPATHDYAIVDKSKKKKKEADENAYATVDKSKKSKKQKPKAPGEVLYADLDDFKPVQAPSMPTVSTSPEPLAPLKRPTPYQGTEYADITQFFKGNATLPEGQSTEMQPTYANAGGGQEAANKENANTGGEGGGGDTEPKETPM